MVTANAIVALNGLCTVKSFGGGVFGFGGLALLRMIPALQLPESAAVPRWDYGDAVVRLDAYSDGWPSDDETKQATVIVAILG